MVTGTTRRLLHPSGLTVLLLALLLLGAQAHAQSSQMPDLSQGFSKNQIHLGFGLGAGAGMAVLGSNEAHDLALGSLHLGWILTDVVGGDQWYRGNWELIGELFGGWQFNPESRHFIGFAPLLRYNFAVGCGWVPFFNLGGGVSETDIGHPDLGGDFQFNLQAGGGTHYFIRRNLAVTVEYRYLHFSNGGIDDPNSGANTNTLRFGLTWFL